MGPLSYPVLASEAYPVADLDFSRGVYRLAGRSWANPADIPGWSFTRASEGYAQTAGGVLVPFASGVPRVTDLGILVEEARTNLLLRSQDFGTTWVPQRATVSANATTAPDGTSTADKLTETAVTNTHYIVQTITVASATVYAYSVYAKAAERSWVALYEGVLGVGKWFNLATGAVGGNLVAPPTGASIEALADGWYRCTIYVTTASTTATPQVYLSPDGTTSSYLGVVNSGAFVWQADFQAGSFATSPIATAGSAVTRAADIPYVSLTVPSAAVLFVETLGVPVGLTGFPLAASASNAGSTNTVDIFQFGTGGVWSTNVNVSSASQASYSSAVAATTAAKIASSFAANSFNSAVNGVVGTRDTSGSVGSMDRINVGCSRGGSQFINTYIKRVGLFVPDYTDGRIQGITA